MVVAAVVIFYSLVDPEQGCRWIPKCFFKTLTGLQCPGCGTQRALHRLLNGDLSGALHFNAIWALAIPALPLYAAAEWAPGRFPRLHRWLCGRNGCYVLGTVIVIWWVGRNLAGI